jgi:acyl-CoA synthetase (AMP-forming)/AMP-acid ligase II
MMVSEPGFHCEFSRLIVERAEAPALIDARSGTIWTYSDLASLTDRAAAFLAAHDAGEGKTVTTLLPNSVDTLVLFLGALRAGVHVAPLSPQAKARDIRNWLELVDPALCVYTASEQSVVDEAGVLSKSQRAVIDTSGQLDWLGPASAASLE